MTFIQTATLTDEEFAGITAHAQVYTVGVYEELLEVLDSRETVSTTRDRLRDYFLARGVEVDESVPTPQSNIFIGGSLD